MQKALDIVEEGMAVFPLRPGSKLPALGQGWQQRVTRDPEVVRQWWRSAPYNIGVATGTPSSILVVDLDAPPRIGLPHGRQVLAEIARAAEAAIPRETRTVVTPGGGQHLYFRLPDGVDLRNTAGLLGTHIDTRGTGGYVVGAGSTIEGRRYRLVCDADPLPMPNWLLERLRPSAADPRDLTRTPVRHQSAYVAAAMRGEADRVASAAAGTRNDTLFRAAARLGRFVAEGRVSEQEIRSLLTAACAGHVGVAGFSAAEVERAIASGLRRASSGPTAGSHLAQQTRADRLTP